MERTDSDWVTKCMYQVENEGHIVLCIFNKEMQVNENKRFTFSTNFLTNKFAVEDA
jgi:hypothetical protein